MAGCVGITASEAGRFTAFTMALSALQAPEGTEHLWALGMDVVQARNWCVREALEAGADWLWFMDDDHVFTADTLARLLAHDVDVVGCLYVKRQKPFPVTAYQVDGGDEFVPLDLARLPAEGLREVHALGTAGLLIRRRVMEAMKPPWFEPYWHGEDAFFCKRLWNMGVPVYVDLAARLGHMATCALWPAHNDGRWKVSFNVAGARLEADVAAREGDPKAALPRVAFTPPRSGPRLR